MPRALYDYYKELPRPPTLNYSVFVTHPFDDDYIKLLVDSMEKIARQEQFNDLEKIEFATAFVQHLPYAVDSVTTPYDEYPRYPFETLVDKVGDCEDTSILLASLLYEMGYRIVMVIFPETPDTGSHCGIGILGSEGMFGTYFEYAGENYFYVETSGRGWHVGDIPEKYEGVGAYLFDMKPTPMLAHSWTATGEGATVELEVAVENLGSATAHDVYLLVGFDTGAGMLWNAQESRPFQLLINERITVTFSLEVPLEKHTRLVVYVVDDEYAVDESYSEWFDTQ